MLTTEEEAKTKLCQEAFGGPGPRAAACLGSACMAWRWIIESHTHHQSKRGYCGKAGKP